MAVLVAIDEKERPPVYCAVVVLGNKTLKGRSSSFGRAREGGLGGSRHTDVVRTSPWSRPLNVLP